MLLAPTLSLSSGSGAAIVRPTFSRDFAGEKTLNNGTGPAITFTRASDATYFDANDTLQTAGSNVPRFDHSATSSLGLLIEESRTNSIRNSQAGGSVAGAAGTAPTNWSSATTTGGLSREIVGSGSVSGFSYVDIRYSGTTTSTSGFGIFFEPINQVAATNSQAWTNSLYVALVAGSTTGLNGIQVAIDQTDGSSNLGILRGSNIRDQLTSSLRRHSHSATTNNASITHVRPLLEVSYATGQAIDFTLRIAAPQLEQGAFPTSYIPTTTAAATRAADSAVVTPISSFYNQAEGTLFAEGSAGGAANNNAALVSVDDASANERIQLRRNKSAGQANAVVSDGGVLQANILTGTWTSDTAVQKVIAAYKADDIAIALNGATPATDTATTLPTVTQMVIGFGQNSQHVNGHIRKIAYWPRRLSNTLLQQLTM
jgi:hypothetical protein